MTDGKAGQQPAKRWYVRRDIRVGTSAGEPIWEREWLAPDGSWHPDRAQARWFEQGDRTRVFALVTRIREEADAVGDPTVGEAVGVLLSRPEAGEAD